MRPSAAELSDKLTVSSASLRTRSAYRRLLSSTRTPPEGSAHAPPIKGVRADCASSIKNMNVFNEAGSRLNSRR